MPSESIKPCLFVICYKNLPLSRKLKHVCHGIFTSLRNGFNGIKLGGVKAYLEKQGLILDPSTRITIPNDDDRLIVRGGVWVGAYSVIWIGDDPQRNNKGRMILGSKVYIGEHSNIRASGGVVDIGDNVLIANGVTMVASNHGTKLGEPMFDQPWAENPSDVIIGSDVWIGANVVLLPGTRIHSGAIIAAGAVVRGEVAANSIYGGVPAKFLKHRSQGP